MQIRGKILTIAGIVLIFGYFIKESFVNPIDPTQVVMVGKDTLGRDWGAIANQKDQERLQKQNQENNDGLSTKMGTSFDIPTSEDPFRKEKFNQENYSSVQSPDGREIITGYDRPEEQAGQSSSDDNYQTRHQKEKSLEEPSIIYKE